MKYPRTRQGMARRRAACDALISKKTDVVRAPFGNSSPDEFKTWLANLGKAARKD